DDHPDKQPMRRFPWAIVLAVSLGIVFFILLLLALLMYYRHSASPHAASDPDIELVLMVGVGGGSVNV
ncbi:hypothetical protein A2U01_0038858, partial [Trifolium medium]|nr:hypothetical protein [Trifolium medium]